MLTEWEKVGAEFLPQCVLCVLCLHNVACSVAYLVFVHFQGCIHLVFRPITFQFVGTLCFMPTHCYSVAYLVFAHSQGCIHLVYRPITFQFVGTFCFMPTEVLLCGLFSLCPLPGPYSFSTQAPFFSVCRYFVFLPTQCYLLCGLLSLCPLPGPYSFSIQAHYFNPALGRGGRGITIALSRLGDEQTLVFISFWQLLYSAAVYRSVKETPAFITFWQLPYTGTGNGCCIAWQEDSKERVTKTYQRRQSENRYNTIPTQNSADYIYFGKFKRHFLKYFNINISTLFEKFNSLGIQLYRKLSSTFWEYNILGIQHFGPIGELLRCRQWVSAIGRTDFETKSVDILNKNYYVCYCHFSNSVIKITKTRWCLYKDAVPTLQLPQPESIPITPSH
ncbi:THAP domain-containing protein [Phthorimaea operculella]|nr:THAP domain-containing protein [Phthorimaea operculella]